MSAQLALRIVRADDAPRPDGTGPAAPFPEGESLYWTKVPELARREIRGNALGVLQAIVAACRGGRETTALNTELAHDVGLSPDTVSRHVGALQAKGWIECSHAHNRRTIKLAFDLVGQPAKLADPPLQPCSAGAAELQRGRCRTAARPSKEDRACGLRQERLFETVRPTHAGACEAPPADDGRTDGLPHGPEEPKAPETPASPPEAPTTPVAAPAAPSPADRPADPVEASTGETAALAATPADGRDARDDTPRPADPLLHAARLKARLQSDYAVSLALSPDGRSIRMIPTGDNREIPPELLEALRREKPALLQLLHAAGKPHADPPKRDKPLDDACRKVLELKRANAGALELATAVSHAFGEPDNPRLIRDTAEGLRRATESELRDWLHAARHSTAKSGPAVLISRIRERFPELRPRSRPDLARSP